MGKYKKKKMINILFMLMIIILLVVTIFINKDYSFILDKKIINNNVSLERYSDYKFVTLSMKNAKETRFSLSDNDNKSIIYIIKYRDKSILVELSEHTVVTEKMDVMFMDDTSNTKMLKSNINEEIDEELDFIKGYYTNINLQMNLKIIIIKFYVTLSLIGISFLLLIINLIQFIVKKDEIYEPYSYN